MFVRGTPPEASYIFKHALVQDTAYGTLLRDRRQWPHGQIAATLEDRFLDIVLAQPALLAHHCSEAGLTEKAVGYSLKAGQQAMARSAIAEAVAQLRNGLDLLASTADDLWRQRQELELLLALRPALALTKGFSAAETGEALSRARALSEQLDQPKYLVSLIWGEWGFHLVRAEHRLALTLGEQLEEIAKARNDSAAQFLGRFMHGTTRLHLGQFVVARAILESCLDLADPALRTVELAPIDPHAAMLSYLAMALAHLGYIDQGRLRLDEALSEARRLGHVATLAHVLLRAISFDLTTRLSSERTEEFRTFTTKHGPRYYSMWARILRGGSLIALGQEQEGLALLTQELAELLANGAVVGLPSLLAGLAKAYTD